MPQTTDELKILNSGEICFTADLSSHSLLLDALKKFNYNSKIFMALNALGGYFKTSKPGMKLKLVEVNTQDMGLAWSASHNEILARGIELGLDILPPETPVQFMLDGTFPVSLKDFPKFATPAVIVKSRRNKSAFVWTVTHFREGEVRSLDAYVYDSPDQKTIGTGGGNYIFAVPQ